MLYLRLLHFILLSTTSNWLILRLTQTLVIPLECLNLLLGFNYTGRCDGSLAMFATHVYVDVLGQQIAPMFAV